MPLLLGIICLISARHSSLPPLPSSEVDPEIPRNVWVHNWLWDYIQTMFSRTVWTEASSRSIGTIFGFLLVSEWNPRAIHTHASDYANDFKSSALEEEADRPDLSAFSAAQRSDGMCWMTIGNALRLAENLNLLETHPQVFLAIHLSEITLAIRLGRRSSVSQFLCDNDVEDFKKMCQRLSLSKEHLAMLEILKLSAMAHDTLYRPKASTHTNSRHEGSTLFFNLLDLFANSLHTLRNSHPEYLSDESLEGAKSRISRSSPGEIPTADMELISLAFEYFYACLYVYSLSLTNTDPNQNGSRNLRSMDILYMSKYGELAVGAALEIIDIARAMASAKSLCHAPVRWMVRIVHAIVFLVKNILLSADLRIETHEPSIRAIECASDLLKSMAIDELHLSARYARTTALLCGQIRDKLSEHSTSKHSTCKRPRLLKPSTQKMDLSYDDEQKNSQNTSDNATKAGNLASFFTDLDVDFGTQGFEGLAFADTFLDEVEHFFKVEN